MSIQKSHIEDPQKCHLAPPFEKAREQDPPGLDAKLDPKADFGEEHYQGSNRLAGHKALITGGDSGIGRAVALAYAREGCDVAIAYLPSEEVDASETRRLVESAGRKALLMAGDLMDPSFCQHIVQQCVQQLGGITILVNNAAYQGKSVGSLLDLDHDRVSRTFLTNIVSFFDCAREAIKHMKPGSCIINTGSIQAYDPSASILDYACTKAAIVAFTKGLSAEVIDKGIRVNCVAPGPVWTPLVAQSFPNEKLQHFGEANPTKRPAQPCELSPAYVFLADSKQSSYVSGEVLGVTGGGILA